MSIYHNDGPHTEHLNTRMITFRVTKKEYESFKALSLNTSDFLRYVLNAVCSADVPTIDTLNKLLDRRIDQLSQFRTERKLPPHIAALPKNPKTTIEGVASISKPGSHTDRSAPTILDIITSDR